MPASLRNLLLFIPGIMFNPIATYRIQFHKEFTFSDFERIIPYLADLGVSTIYASPIFEAVPGSNHGYDVTDPHCINPEIGTLEQFRKISKKLRLAGISWLQDIVPNHMAFHDKNLRLMDILENGRSSVYSGFFDIFWDAAGFEGKLMIPVLGDTVDQIVNNRQISVTITPGGGFSFDYGGQYYPLNAGSYLQVIGSTDKNLSSKLKTVIAELSREVPNVAEIKSLLCKSAGLEDDARFLNDAVNKINSDPEKLQSLLDKQHYRLAYWKESDSRMNYRRFFTVNSLICLNMQDELVFREYHRFIKSLLDEGLIQGLRVDHIDGLFDPACYLERLRALAGDEVFIVVEKILEEGESFPVNWPVQGNTGYDFLAQVNNLLTSNENKGVFTSFYHALIEEKPDIPSAISEKKAAILKKSMGGELNNLHQLFFDLRLDHGKKISGKLSKQLKTAIGRFLVQCPVYRYYGNQFPLSAEEKNLLRAIFDAVVEWDHSLKKAVGLLEEIFFYKGSSEDLKAGCLLFYQRCMQFAGPLMAKGVEDTLMYTYERFLGHNEVGDSPDAFGIEVANFHMQMIKRQELWPLSLNATSTHDTKRGEDVRARLNVLTDLGEDWIKTVRKWFKLNNTLKESDKPDRNDEYLIYQTLCGCYPMPGHDPADLGDRLKAYLTKALREAKVHTQWAQPNEDYEMATLNLAGKLLSVTTPFHKSLLGLQQDIADLTVINSLTQVMLKFTCPGVPDVYQGCESWDFSLVDPDNRRTVDYKTRSRALQRDFTLESLWNDRYSGNIKTWLTGILFKCRRDHPELFSDGSYIPLRVKGKYKKNVIAFARRHVNEWLIVVAPLHLGTLGENPLPMDWENTKIVLPENAPLVWLDILSGAKMHIPDELMITGIFQVMPFGLLHASRPQSKRGAGMIMHITSLPSSYGVGDMGPEARNFADFLMEAGQQYWQLLPINATNAAAAFSPYSACSSMAGYTLLISPEELVRDGWLTRSEIKKYELEPGAAADFKHAGRSRQKLFERAFNTFQKNADTSMLNDYDQFKKNEASWLNDFALYETLREAQKGKPWYQWTARFKLRHAEAIKAFRNTHSSEIEQAKWLQYIFLKQWTKLKAYVNSLGIKIIGDLPFYVSYDSADVWIDPGLFKLDKNHDMAAVAGVPPDYFNSSGQLWGMPVYDWQEHERTGYQWWQSRLSKNLQFFDLVRLDHFRAFYDFWEVPADETTAINGAWQPGPGAALFKAFDGSLQNLPFIAEDLGDISDGVYQLRDQLGLPGMNVLQYAFGPEMPVSVHAPHNHKNHSVTYTGTHDNNTLVGWFRKDASKDARANLEHYICGKVNETNVNDVLIDLCYRSASNIAITPVQDVLGLDENHRMNTPSAGKNNWLWRLEPGQLKSSHALSLAKLAKKYNR